MHAFKDLEDYRKSVYRLFGKFPLLLLVIGVVLAYVVGIILTNFGIGDMKDPIGYEGLANGFFRGVLGAVGIYYVSRMMSESTIKKSHGLTDREPEGVFIPCMSHKNFFELTMGNIVIKKDRLYFEPGRAFAGDLTFDFSDYNGFSFTLSEPKESLGLFLITGENYMILVLNDKGETLGRFIMPQPELNLPLIQPLLAQEHLVELVQE